jgi:hypothetical protein
MLVDQDSTGLLTAVPLVISNNRAVRIVAIARKMYVWRSSVASSPVKHRAKEIQKQLIDNRSIEVKIFRLTT